jgi:hypothetical protein
VRYVLLIYQSPGLMESFSPEEIQEIFAQVDGLIQEYTASGEWIGGEALADPTNAKTIRLRDGVPAVTDGPFGEAKEYLAGYCLFDCETEERALEIAARWPIARDSALELRPLMQQAGMEM